MDIASGRVTGVSVKAGRVSKEGTVALTVASTAGSVTGTGMDMPGSMETGVISSGSAEMSSGVGMDMEPWRDLTRIR